MAKEFTIIENPDKITELKDLGFTRVEESAIGGAWGNLDKKFKVYAPVPRTDEEAQERYRCSIEDLIAAGVQKFFTQVNYETLVIEFDKDGKAITTTVDNRQNVKQFRSDMSDEEIHQALQDAVDNYEVGKRAPGKAKQDKQTLDTLGAMAVSMGFENTPSGRDACLAALKAKHAG